MIEFGSVQRLAADLLGAGAKVVAGAREVVEHSSQRVEETAKTLAPGGPSLPDYAETITHEVHVDGSVVTGEIGPEKRGQGNLGHILERGTATSPPHPHVQPAGDQELDNLARELGHVGAWAVR
jgi:hypothetical protein